MQNHEFLLKEWRLRVCSNAWILDFSIVKRLNGKNSLPFSLCVFCCCCFESLNLVMNQWKRFHTVCITMSASFFSSVLFFHIWLPDHKYSNWGLLVFVNWNFVQAYEFYELEVKKNNIRFNYSKLDTIINRCHVVVLLFSFNFQFIVVNNWFNFRSINFNIHAWFNFEKQLKFVMEVLIFFFASEEDFSILELKWN